MTALLVALGAAVGAPLRYALAHTLDERSPTGTMVANVVGSLLIGIFASLALGGQAWALLATGFCGGLTSFSAFAVQSVERGPRLGTAYATATVVLTLAACALGFAIGAALPVG
ncbi:fluoride efflux transporter FluC [Nocardioides currus]|uniref:Fluoride-specific ion channel FluC n=1 Tax=Nocardioides currus TaxID=2133958 RepID=A0A2R7YYK6_9ACTN|nr:CrcB family protein [Nocardioides currus]PUA81452.1 fluoride efflux transporter CrcB [Nocardioides currus]